MDVIWTWYIYICPVYLNVALLGAEITQWAKYMIFMEYNNIIVIIICQPQKYITLLL